MLISSESNQENLFKVSMDKGKLNSLFGFIYLFIHNTNFHTFSCCLLVIGINAFIVYTTIFILKFGC